MLTTLVFQEPDKTKGASYIETPERKAPEWRGTSGKMAGAISVTHHRDTKQSKGVGMSRPFRSSVTGERENAGGVNRR